MNKISSERKIQILSALIEGMSIRSVERMTNTHRDTIMRLLVRIGKGCEKLLEENMRGFHSTYFEADEIWTFVKKKERRVEIEEKNNPNIGDQYVFVALDAQSKLIPVFYVGKRNMETTRAFITNLKSKLNGNGRIQLTPDSFNHTSEQLKSLSGMRLILHSKQNFTLL